MGFAWQKPRRTGLSVAWAGEYRERIRLYADVGHGEGNTPEGWAQRAREGIQDGYQAIKFDIDNSANELKQDAVNRELSTAELRKMTSLVAAAREAAGDEIDISIDCHSLFSVHAAMKLAECLEPFNLMFLEDPVPNDNVEAMAKVSAATSIPICTGEFLFRRDGFRDLIQTQACDMLHVDVSGTGGILEAKEDCGSGGSVLYAVCRAQHHIANRHDSGGACLCRGTEFHRHGTPVSRGSGGVAMGFGGFRRTAHSR